jgi:hypothetical protein
MLASTLGIEFDPDAAWNERRRVYETSSLIIESTSITAFAQGDRTGRWTCDRRNSNAADRSTKKERIDRSLFVFPMWDYLLRCVEPGLMSLAPPGFSCFWPGAKSLPVLSVLFCCF